jgi:epoxyqueuosine reductase QueG
MQNILKMPTLPTKITPETVKAYCIEAGANVVGIAASEDFDLAPEGFKPADNLEGCRSVIVLGATFPQEVLSNTVDYTASRNAMLTKMTDMAKEVAKQIKRDGYKAREISGAGGKWVECNGRKEQLGHISLKHAAELAGFGVIGRNYLLTNPQYGNLLWLSAVLTDADLIPDKKLPYKICDNCNKCVETCPLGALDNPASFGRKECSKFFTIVNKKFEIQCFSCRTVCPHCFGNV